MNKNVLKLLCCPYCKADLRLESRKIIVGDTIEKGHEDVVDGFLLCLDCRREYPIINGIPRLCTELWSSEIKELEGFRKRTDVIVKHKTDGILKCDVYTEIEKIIRKKITMPDNASDYLKKRIENDIRYRVKECEKQEKYIKTLNLYYDKAINIILEIGGGQGGLIKCLTEYFHPTFSVMCDYDLSWVEVARLRNPNVQVIRGDATNLPFKKKCFDLVISQAMLEHVQNYDKAIIEMCEATKGICFVSWNPNKFSIYDFGHLDAPITILPKKVAILVAILWHKLRKTGRTKISIINDIEKTFYISTTHVKKYLKKYGICYNVFTDFALFSIESNYSYKGEKTKRILKKYNFFARLLFNLLVLLRIEPNGYYILVKDT